MNGASFEKMRSMLLGREGAFDPDLLAELAPVLAEPVVEKLLETLLVHCIFMDRGTKSRIIAQIITRLPPSPSSGLLARLFEEFPEFCERVPISSLEEVLKSDRLFSDKKLRVMAALLKRIPQEAQEEAVDGFWEKLPEWGISKEAFTVEAINACNLLSTEDRQALLEIVSNFESPFYKAQALICLAGKSIGGSIRDQLLADALEAAQNEEYDENRLEVLLNLLRHDPPESLREVAGQAALAAAQNLHQQEARIEALLEVAEHLTEPLKNRIPQECLQAALELVKFYQGESSLPWYQIDSLTNLAEAGQKLPEPLRKELLQAIIGRYEEYVERNPGLSQEIAQGLINLAPYLSRGCIAQILAIVGKMRGEWGRARVIESYRPLLTEAEQERFARERAIFDGGRAQMQNLLQQMDENERAQVWDMLQMAISGYDGGAPLQTAMEAFQEPPPRYADFVFYTEELKKPGPQVAAGCPLRAGDWYRLEVAVRDEPLGIPPEEERLPIREPKQAKDVTIMVTLKGEGFEIEEPVQALILPPLGKSQENAWFRLRPLQKSTSVEDLAKLSVRLYYEFNLLEEALISAEVVGKHDDPVQSRLGLANPIKFKQERQEREYVDFDDIAPRAMHIDVSKSEAHFHFNFLFYNSQEQKVMFPTPARLPKAELEHELIKIRDLWYAIAMSPAYVEGLEGKRAEFDNHVYKLAQAGRSLWALMFNRDIGSSLFQVGKWLEQHPLPSDALIQISMDEKAGDFIFPWGLLYDRKVPEEEERYTLDRQGFWGLRYCIEQQPPEVKRLPDRPVRVDEPLRLRFMLWESFPNADKEISLIEELAARSAGKVEINFPPIINADECLEILEDCQEHILYFYAHGHTERRQTDLDISSWLHEFLRKYELLPESSPERKKFSFLVESMKESDQPSSIKLTHGKLILDDLYNRIDKPFSSRPFVFLNMCESAQITPSLSKSFVHFFLNRGASAVLGTECPMTVEFAHPFAQEFLTGILAGEEAGLMLLKARRQFMERRNPLGLAYSLYGPATTNFQPPRFPLPASAAASPSSLDTTA